MRTVFVDIGAAVLRELDVLALAGPPRRAQVEQECSSLTQLRRSVERGDGLECVRTYLYALLQLGVFTKLEDTAFPWRFGGVLVSNRGIEFELACVVFDAGILSAHAQDWPQAAMWFTWAAVLLEGAEARAAEALASEARLKIQMPQPPLVTREEVLQAIKTEVQNKKPMADDLCCFDQLDPAGRLRLALIQTDAFVSLEFMHAPGTVPPMLLHPPKLPVFDAPRDTPQAEAMLELSALYADVKYAAVLKPEQIAEILAIKPVPALRAPSPLLMEARKLYSEVCVCIQRCEKGLNVPEAEIESLCAQCMELQNSVQKVPHRLATKIASLAAVHRAQLIAAHVAYRASLLRSSVFEQKQKQISSPQLASQDSTPTTSSTSTSSISTTTTSTSPAQPPPPGTSEANSSAPALWTPGSAVLFGR